MLLSLKNHLSYFKDSIFKCFSKVYNRLFLNNFFHNIMLEALRLEEESTIKGVRNRFRLKKELNYTEIKDVRNILLVNNFWSNSDIKYQSKGDKKHYQLKNILIKLNNT